MLYRRMVKVDKDLSILGFGCMRLPTKTNGHIDEPKATKMLRYAIDKGVNYIDTAYPYHNGPTKAMPSLVCKDIMKPSRPTTRLSRSILNIRMLGTTEEVLS